jgi:hypothetical protein
MLASEGHTRRPRSRTHANRRGGAALRAAERPGVAVGERRRPAIRAGRALARPPEPPRGTTAAIRFLQPFASFLSRTTDSASIRPLARGLHAPWLGSDTRSARCGARVAARRMRVGEGIQGSGDIARLAFGRAETLPLHATQVRRPSAQGGGAGDQRIATGLSGEPVPPTIRSGAVMNRHSHRPARSHWVRSPRTAGSRAGGLPSL